MTSGEGVQRFVQAFGFVIDFQLPRLFQLYALLWSPAVVGAAGFTFVRMQRHREIVGLQAAGISRRSLMRPIVEGTLILIVLQGLNQEFMVPKLAPLLARTHGDIGQDAIRAFAVPPTPDGSGRLWCSGTCDPVRGTMADVLVLERDDTGRTVRRIEAAVASWDEDAKLGLFTKHLLEALTGIADQKDFGGNNDGKVTLGEVKGYLDEEMTYQARRRFSRDQQATVSGELNTILVSY